MQTACTTLEYSEKMRGRLEDNSITHCSDLTSTFEASGKW